MRKGSARILVLLGVLILVGLAFVFFAESGSNKENAPKITQAAKHDQEMNVAEMEKKMYLEKLDKFKMMILKFEQRDMTKFKEQTVVLFGKLAMLIDGTPKLTEEMKKNVQEKTKDVKRSAEKIALLDNEAKVVDEIKKGFKSAKEALMQIKKGLECDKPMHKDLCSNIEKRANKIHEKVKQINTKNYKHMTKEIFMDFQSLLRYIFVQMSRPEFVTQVQAEDEGLQVIQVMDDAGLEVSKTEKEKDKDKGNKDKDKGKDKDKEKCGCGH